MDRTARIRVLIADCHDLIRDGLASLVSHQPDMVVVGDARNGDEAVALFRERHPDVALMDLRMHETSSVDAIRTLRAEFPDARILVLATFPEDDEIVPALREGAIDCLLKDTPHNKIFEIIRAVAVGERPHFFLEHYSAC